MSEEKIVSLGDKRNKKEIKKETPKEEKKEATKNNVEYCSFCGRPNHEVLRMVLGPGVNICSECTLIAVQYLIMSEQAPSEEVQKIIDMLWGIARKWQIPNQNNLTLLK